MAIKVNGTTVIDDSRNLVNIASGAGSSTTAGDVGTYTWGRPLNYTQYDIGDTASGIYPISLVARDYFQAVYNTGWLFTGSTSKNVGAIRSGTWRAVMKVPNDGLTGLPALWVRIS